MGKSLERISLGISKKLGERPHAFKLDDPTFLQEDTLDAEGMILKDGVEKLVEKMEILSKHCINQKKFKLNAKSRIDSLEQQTHLMVPKDMFHSEMEKLEERMVQFIRDGTTKLSTDIRQLREDLNTTRGNFEKRVDDYKSQVLWRIVECEERIRERVARTEVKNMQEG